MQGDTKCLSKRGWRKFSETKTKKANTMTTKLHKTTAEQLPPVDMNTLAKLAGMAYHGGKPVAHWLALVGVDPASVSEIQIRNGLCYWTARAERLYRHHITSVHADQHALGIR